METVCDDDCQSLPDQFPHWKSGANGLALFQRHRPVFEHWLDTFERRAAPLKFSSYKDADGRFTLEAPTSPWTRSAEPSTGETFFIAAAGPGPVPAGMLTIRRFASGGLYKDGRSFLEAQARHGLAAIQTRHLPAGEALSLELDRVVASRDMPELAGKPDFHYRARRVVFQRRDDFFVVSWMAARASFQDGLPALERVLKTLRFAR